MNLKIYTFSCLRFRKLKLVFILLCILVICILNYQNTYISFYRPHSFIIKNISDENIRDLQRILQELDELEEDLNSSSPVLPGNKQCMATEIKLNFEKWKASAADHRHPSCLESNFVTIKNDGTVKFEYDYLQKKNIQLRSCYINAVKWGESDFKFLNARSFIINHNDKVDTNEEFFTIKCKTNKVRPTITGHFAKIFKKNEKFKKQPAKEPINIMFIGLDSVSRIKWLKQLPKSSEFLIETLRSKVLTGYNIVGDGTPAALIPILTGKHESELPSTLKGLKNSVTVDNAYPFIWNLFQDKLNYATLYNEDWPGAGCFQYRMKGFSKPPTTHYMRPLQMASTTKLCNHGISAFEFNLEYAVDFMNMYKDTGFFGFMHIKEYTHNEGVNDIRWLDDTLYKFYKDFKESSLSSNTILVMFSDHGPRYSSLRKSVKGLLQERNPFFSIYLPSLFKLRYPEEAINLKNNINIISAPMDIHATLLDFIDLELNSEKLKDPGNERNFLNNTKRGLSLFGKISENRTCGDAGIDTYWCACLKRVQIPINNEINRLAEKFVKYLNVQILKDHSDLCETLELDKVNSVYQVDSYIDPTLKMFQRKLTPEEIKLNLLKPPVVEKNFMKYLFQVQTKPNGGIYEFEIEVEKNLRDAGNNKQTRMELPALAHNLISRINKYGNDEHCIHDKFPDLRKFCYCKVKFSEQISETTRGNHELKSGEEGTTDKN